LFLQRGRKIESCGRKGEKFRVWFLKRGGVEVGSFGRKGQNVSQVSEKGEKSRVVRQKGREM